MALSEGVGAGLVLGLQALDKVTTGKAFAIGGAGVEANPVSASLLGAHLLWPAKLVAGLVVLVCALRVKPGRRWVRVLVWSAAVFYAGVVTLNAVQVWRWSA